MATVLMTRKEAISKCHGIVHPEAFVQALEALGLLVTKQEPEKMIQISMSNLHAHMKAEFIKMGYHDNSCGMTDLERAVYSLFDK